MIIKNNFNDRDIDPLNDYTSIGKGSHSLDRELEKEKEGFIKENMKDPILKKLRESGNILDDDRDEDDWKFFR